MNIDRSEVFPDANAAARWLKNALVGWYVDGVADAYAPFAECFSFRLDPGQILDEIYRKLPAARGIDYQGGPKAALREGAALLLNDGELLRDHPVAFSELLSFGGMIGSIEILASITGKIGQPLMRGGEGRESLASLAFQIVRRTYSEPGDDFFAAAERNVGTYGIGVDDLLLGWARQDPASWADHVLRLNAHLYDFYLERLSSPVGDMSLEYFANNLGKAVGTTLYRTGMSKVRQSALWDQLNWLLTYATEHQYEISAAARDRFQVIEVAACSPRAYAANPRWDLVGLAVAR